MSSGGFAVTTGLGFCSQASEALHALLQFAHRGEVLIEPRPGRPSTTSGSSRAVSSPRKSIMLRPCRSASTVAATSSGLPWTNSFWNSRFGLLSAGMGEPLRV